ncbi:MAG: hypothetical protein HZA16_02390 [Nitrospirae bacterium]|nr:hypothetical protein [Nitrospirota bacterium]
MNPGHPVNVASGTVYTSETDFVVKGVMPITFTRYYDSAEAETTVRGFGPRWRHTYSTMIVAFSGGGNTYT